MEVNPEIKACDVSCQEFTVTSELNIVWSSYTNNTLKGKTKEMGYLTLLVYS